MSHFYGNLGSVTRCGHKSSGLSAHVRGWNSGVEIVADYIQENKTLEGKVNPAADAFSIYATHGSNGCGTKIYLGEVRMVKGALSFYPAKSISRKKVSKYIKLT